MPKGRTGTVLDFTAIAACAPAWGTAWYAITLQFGSVDTGVSLVYRFGLAAALLVLAHGSSGITGVRTSASRTP